MDDNKDEKYFFNICLSCRLKTYIYPSGKQLLVYVTSNLDENIKSTDTFGIYPLDFRE